MADPRTAPVRSGFNMLFSFLGVISRHARNGGDRVEAWSRRFRRRLFSDSVEHRAGVGGVSHIFRIDVTPVADIRIVAPGFFSSWITLAIFCSLRMASSSRSISGVAPADLLVPATRGAGRHIERDHRDGAAEPCEGGGSITGKPSAAARD